MKINGSGESEKTNPIQSQFPKGQNERKLIYNKGLQKKRWFHSPKKQTQFKPNFRKAQNERKLIYNKGLQKKRWFHSPKKQTQSNPIPPQPFLFVKVF